MRTRAALLVLCLVTGCALLQPVPDPAPLPEPVADDDLAELVRYTLHTRELDPGALEEEYTLVRDSAPGPERDLRLAVLLSHPKSARYDLAAALALLARPATNDETSFAALLYRLLGERMLDTGMGVAQILERQKETRIGYEAEIRALNDALDRERAQRETLEQQLEALRQIEDRIEQRTDGETGG